MGQYQRQVRANDLRRAHRFSLILDSASVCLCHVCRVVLCHVSVRAFVICAALRRQLMRMTPVQGRGSYAKLRGPKAAAHRPPSQAFKTPLSPFFYFLQF